jgi:hypothetical protein
MIRVAFSTGSPKSTDLFVEHLIEFSGLSGTSPANKQRNVATFHHALSKLFPQARILEVSSKSDKVLGVALSAFNLRFVSQSGNPTVESIFQSGKVFEFGGPFKDLLHKEPAEAKRDPRLKSSGKLQHFESLNGLRFSLETRSDFYDYVYLKALLARPELLTQMAEYDTFTDIEFSKSKVGFVPGQPYNCQARSAAIAVTLFASGGIKAVQEHVLHLETRNQPIVVAASDNYLF